MAIIIPNLKLGHAKATLGEQRFARALETFLNDDWLCFYDVPVGKRRRYPDFILIHPKYGLLFLEVKDWLLRSIKSITHDTVDLETTTGLKSTINPLKQAREGAFAALNMLQADPALKEQDGPYKGRFLCPYGYGVVFTALTRPQIDEQLLANNGANRIFPDHLLLCREDLSTQEPSPTLETRLAGMLPYPFRELTVADINRIRWHLYPELRVEHFFTPAQSNAHTEISAPHNIAILDINQEQLARGLGDGHRVIHGVAGSGKTLILTLRAEILAKLLNKPILVTCFNITLAAKLRHHMQNRGIADKVHVYNFHAWCGSQLQAHGIEVPQNDLSYWDGIVNAVINGVATGRIPRAQYGAVLLDEGHDLEERWLEVLVHMVDPDSNSLLLLYDDAQSIYRQTGRRFALSSVGIQARGRTKLLKINYRNTRQILHLAYEFSKNLLQNKHSDDDHIPLIQPQSGGPEGPLPVFKYCRSFDDEVAFVRDCVTKWARVGIPFRDTAIIYNARWMGEALMEDFPKNNIPFQLLDTSPAKKKYNPQADQIVLLTQHSSKGLEFPRVIIIGVGHTRDKPDNITEETRQLYVAMTRAREHLFITASQTNAYTQKIQSITAWPS